MSQHSLTPSLIEALLSFSKEQNPYGGGKFLEWAFIKLDATFWKKPTSSSPVVVAANEEVRRAESRRAFGSTSRF